jgi:hypothetical protein
MNPGNKLKITKKTFLHKGIFVHTGSIVEFVREIEGGAVEVTYLDKEANPHNITLNQGEWEAVQ